jgi:hypothetical protein
MSDSGLIPLPRYFRSKAEPNNHRLQQYHLKPSLLYSRSSPTSFSNLSLSLHSHIRESSIVVSTALGISLCSLHSHFYELVSPLQDFAICAPISTNQSILLSVESPYSYIVPGCGHCAVSVRSQGVERIRLFAGLGYIISF